VLLTFAVALRACDRCPSYYTQRIQPAAFQAAERSYLNAFRQLGLSGPQTWVSSVMRRLRRRVRDAEKEKLAKLYEQLSANTALRTSAQFRSGIVADPFVWREMSHDNRYPHFNCISRHDR
jgi:hypothetical protein